MARLFTFIIAVAATAWATGCKDDNGGSPGGAGFIKTEDCVALCNLEVSCGLYDTLSFPDDFCRDLCALTVDAMQCLYAYLDGSCQTAYKRYYDCIYGIDNCEDFNLYLSALSDTWDTEGNPSPAGLCEDEVAGFLECADSMSPDLDAGEEFCVEELTSMDNYLGSLEIAADSDTEPSDTDSETDSDSAVTGI